jgi:hypothetical protein
VKSDRARVRIVVLLSFFDAKDGPLVQFTNIAAALPA